MRVQQLGRCNISAILTLFAGSVSDAHNSGHHWIDRNLGHARAKRLGQPAGIVDCLERIEEFHRPDHHLAWRAIHPVEPEDIVDP